ncbi:MAG TPA: EAL domain-containing protein [Candidatus Polarisedimenticolia bacterium]|nr:EAL domain-containing protein [Candidatus Polarisedimenticolia bacterium]
MKRADEMKAAQAGHERERHESASDLLVDRITDLPTVPLLLERMGHQLEKNGFLAILSINILQASNLEKITGWKAFDQIVHDVGKFLASIKTIHLRREDFVAEIMISGNAFVILLAPPRAKAVMELADLCRVRDRLNGKLTRFLGRRLPPTISERFTCFIGASLVHNDAQVRSERLIYRALDEAQADSIAERERASLRHLLALKDVLSGRQIRAVYQPIVDIFRKQIIGWEALSRPTGGPFENIEQLFKAAYEAHSVWSLERLCRERALESLPVLSPGELLFLNVEPDSIYDPQFRSERTLKMLHQAELAPEQVVLEMTEHSAVRDFTAFRQTLNYFRSLGFRFAIDDMGSGYSGLVSVAEIHPDFVKIDMNLIRDLHARPLKRELVDTINRFSQRSGIQVVAEGIESVEELGALREIGITYAQGYLFARPASPPAVLDISSLESSPAASPRHE